MGKVTVVNNVTLDGVMQGPGRPDEDTRGGFLHGGWGAAYQDEVIAREMGRRMAGARGSLLLGRRTYEDFYAVWPGRSDNPFTDHLDRVTKYVASRTLQEPLAWQNAVLLPGDAGDAVARMRAQEGGDLTVLGSGNLLETLIGRNLVDRYVLLIFPLVLGAGRRLFPEGAGVRLRLVDSLASPSGVILATYDAV